MSNKEEKAKECVEKVIKEQYNSHLDSNDIMKAFNIGWDSGKQENEHLVWQISEANYEKGKEIGKKEIINKACEWLKENSGYYVEHWGEDTWVNSKLYENFRKAMIEE